MFLKVLGIILTRFGENNALMAKYIDIYPTHIFCLLFIKTEKVHEHDLY